jgi:hypothetical protein
MPGMLRKSTAFVPRYQKFESISLQQRVNKLSVPEEGYRSGRSTTLRVAIRDNDPAGYDLLVNATAADGAGQQGSPPTGTGIEKGDRAGSLGGD